MLHVAAVALKLYYNSCSNQSKHSCCQEILLTYGMAVYVKKQSMCLLPQILIAIILQS